MSQPNRAEPLVFNKAITSVAANAEQEVRLFVVPMAGKAKIVKVTFTPDTASVTDTDSGYAYRVLSRVAGTAAATTIAAKTMGTAAAATWSASLPATLTLSTVAGACEANNGVVITWAESTIGSGTARSNGDVQIEYVLL